MNEWMNEWMKNFIHVSTYLINTYIYLIFMLYPQLASAKYVDTWIKFFIRSFILTLTPDDFTRQWGTPWQEKG